MKNLVVVVALTLLVVGCAASGSSSSSTPLPLKLISSKMAENCRFIGVTSGHVHNPLQRSSDNISDARLKAANEAVTSGANAAVVTSTDVESPGHDVTVNMDAYECSEEMIR